MDLEDIAHEADLIADIRVPISGTLTRAKIDAALLANDYTLPLENKVTFHLMDFSGQDRMWLITWFPALDYYSTLLMKIKV